LVWQHLVARGIITGVVDWTGAAAGPPGLDIGWCRLDLYLLQGQRVADQFLDTYQAASHRALPQARLCDLWAVARSFGHVDAWVPNYRDLGRTDLTARELRARHTAWTQRLMDSL
jgi:aminoglycoside phosphotransferase (APT) family kinase protein